MIKFHKDGSRPLLGEVFVFGSNLAGIHGAGAAKAALDYYGAEFGVGIGMTGNSYAIPTKTGTFECIDLGNISGHVGAFVQFTRDHPEFDFFVTRVGCGLAGNSNEDIAPMFKGAENCSFPIEWKEYL